MSRRLQLLQRTADVLLGQDVYHLQRDAEHRSDLIGPQQRRAEVDRDDHIGAHLARDVDRQIAHQSAVDQLLIADGDRRHCARHRHRCTDGLHDTAFLQHHHFAGADVGGDGAKRDRQFVEAARGADLNQPTQFAFKRHTGDHAFRQGNAVPADAEFRNDVRRLVVCLLPHRLVGARRLVGEELLGGDRTDHLFHLRHRQTGRVRRTDDRAHARAGDHVDRHAQFLENLQHTDMRGAARASAREHEADLRSRRLGAARLWRRRQLRHRGPGQCRDA